MENKSKFPAWEVRRFVLTVAILSCGFAIPLWKLFRFAAGSELYSYILLIPFISVYLVWLKRASLPLSVPPARLLGVAFLLAGSVLLAAYWLWLRPAVLAVNEDYFSVMTICFLLFLYGIASLFWGLPAMRVAAFPLGFLILLSPLPPSAIQEMDAFLQSGSASVAAGFFWLSGTPFLQDGLTFQLSDIKLSIAPECSGIHSTIVLFITALLCGHIFLRRLWKRVVLVLIVVLLGLLRNGFRVFVIGQLCILWGPQMIESPLHRKGGPIFFLLSLIPFFLLLFLLLKSEKRPSGQTTSIERQPCAN
ncbi:MAG TPA: archaeosortase/exosortase family protein [Verrucomicrobiae bacterium]|nr:archaeosortase/exosortase family protein [Verrucomicrobiae bacterium]